MSSVISRETLLQRIQEWMNQGRRAVGPRRMKPDLIQYGILENPQDLLWDGYIHPANSIKEWIFPRHETLYCYNMQGKEIDIQDAVMDIPETLIIGARPCDAASLPILDRVFHWDFEDVFYNRRREAITLVTVACREHDDACFCTSVGVGPATEMGSDAILIPLESGQYEVRCMTPKGEALFSGYTQPSDIKARDFPGPDKGLDLNRIRETITKHFEDPFWAESTRSCLGCGACAHVCPTCHCFDIAEEGNAHGGRRVRNWDSCQFKMFTLHASGHNPRSVQAQRQRQRIYHKFAVYPEKFGPVLCTGCGNCVRNCPAGLGVFGVLEALDRKSREAQHAEHL